LILVRLKANPTFIEGAMNNVKNRFGFWLGVLSSVLMAACHAENSSTGEQSLKAEKASVAVLQPYKVNKMSELKEPWAIILLPDQRLLISEKAGALLNKR
jgi:glucose/arabinose dehydrogenase